MSWRSQPGHATQLRNRKPSLRGFGLCPVVVLMTLEAAPFGCFFGFVLAMALLASLNAGQEHVGCLAAVQRIRMARAAGHHAVGVMIKPGMGQPASRQVGFCHHGQRATVGTQ